MRQLSDILVEKIEEVGGKAALGRMLGGLTGQAILQYINGGMPSLTFALRWKEAFGENLLDLMFENACAEREKIKDILNPGRSKSVNEPALVYENDYSQDMIAIVVEQSRNQLKYIQYLEGKIKELEIAIKKLHT